MELTSEQLREMDVPQLTWVCHQAGIATKPGWSKSEILTKLLSAASAASNY